ncbi:MAG: P44/Msp2 family outer membrane protein, partial [Sphingomonadaceae bacterium]|nr:P44/Msp2 family outer membrane protein [Sphingomonadaceae bacterium]
MRKLALAAVLASTVLATPAVARDKAWYVGVEGGASIVEDQDFNLAGIKGNANADLKTGWDIDGIVGYDFGGFRLEAEAGYKRAKLDQWTSQLTTPAGASGTATPAGTFASASGHGSNLSFMLNGLLDFGEDDGTAGYLGVGAGIGRTLASYTIDANGADFLSDSDTGFAWQAIAGVRTPLSRNVDIGHD